MTDLREKLNNFHGYFPGGMYLNEENTIKQEIISEVKTYITSNEFNLSLYMAIIDTLTFYNDFLITNVDTNKSDAETLKINLELFQNSVLEKKLNDSIMERNQMIEPIFDYLVEKGYNPKELRK